MAEEIAIGLGVAGAAILGTSILARKTPTTPINEEEDMSAAIPVLTKISEALNSMLDILKSDSELGHRRVFTEILTIGTTPAVLYPTSKKVAGGSMMNLSTTDTITLGAMLGNTGNNLTSLTKGNGFVMNPAAAAGQGGGTFNFPNIDLANITAVTSTNAAQSLLVVYYE